MESGTSRATQGTCAKAEAYRLVRSLNCTSVLALGSSRKTPVSITVSAGIPHVMLVRMLAKVSPAAAV